MYFGVSETYQTPEKPLSLESVPRSDWRTRLWGPVTAGQTSRRLCWGCQRFLAKFEQLENKHASDECVLCKELDVSSWKTWVSVWILLLPGFMILDKPLSVIYQITYVRRV